MTKERKTLRELSILILVFAGISLVRAILDTLSVGVFHKGELPEGITEGLLLAGTIVTCVLCVVIFLPELYLGIKGMKIAKKPDSSKAPIVWAIILGVIAVIGIISPISSLIKGVDILGNIVELLNCAANMILYFGYAVYARRVLKA